MKELIEYLNSTSTKQAELARRLNTSRGYVADLVKGRRKPGRDMAIAIEKATGGSVPVTIWSARQPRPSKPASKGRASA